MFMDPIVEFGAACSIARTGNTPHYRKGEYLLIVLSERFLTLLVHCLAFLYMVLLQVPVKDVENAAPQVGLHGLDILFHVALVEVERCVKHIIK